MSRTTVCILLASLVALTACRRVETSATSSSTATPSVAIAGDAGRGRELITRHGCNVCHAVPGIDGFQGRLGPSLEGIASRPVLSFGRVPNTPDNLVKFIRNPASLNPQSTMPPVNVTVEEASDITAYLLKLK